MVRWHPLPVDLPEPVATFKHELRRVINARGYTNLGQLAQRSGVPPSTISDAASSGTMPTERTLTRILTACGNPELRDGRYESWPRLYKLACDALRAALPVEDQAVSLTNSPINGSPPTITQHPTAFFRQTRVTADWTETTEIFVYTDTLAFQLAQRHLPVGGEDPGAPEEPRDELNKKPKDGRMGGPHAG